MKESPVVGHTVLGPQPFDDLDALFESRAALVHIDPEGVELRRDERAPEPNVQPPVADVVQHRQLPSELDRMVEGGDHGPGDRPQVAGARRDGR
jgi:hypothetical protein